MPANPYGPNDNFDPRRSHVLPALIRRFHEAKEGRLCKRGGPGGTRNSRREFLHVGDLAAASLFLLENYDAADPIIVGVGVDVTIRELTEMVADVVGFDGVLIQDLSKPDGTPRKLLDVSKINNLAWKATMPLREGIAATYKRSLDSRAANRL